MSTLVCWVGVDTHGTSSVYIATDSRISLAQRISGPNWDNGQKAYASSSMPLILGYVGGGFYSVHVAPRLIAYSQAIAKTTEAPEEAIQRMVKFTEAAMASAPALITTEFEFICALRGPTKNAFVVASIYASRSGAHSRIHGLPEKSGIVHIAGSGADFVKRRFDEWQKSHAADTSRAIYSAFCDALLHATKDPWSEGPPQLVGIYRIGPGRYFATAWRDRCYFGGIPVDGPLGDVQCRNEIFERCNPTTLLRLDGAKQHHRI